MSYSDDSAPNLNTFEEVGCDECAYYQRQLAYLNERIHECPSTKLMSFAEAFKSLDNTAARKRDELAREHRELMSNIRAHIQRSHTETQ